MGITQQDASDALEQIQTVGTGIQDRLKYYHMGPILILWGVIAAVCFSMTHFARGLANWAWLIGDSIGIAAIIGDAIWAMRHGPVQSQTAKREGWRIFWFWFLLFIYADIWLLVLAPWQGDQLGVFLVTLVMFGYVVMGLWLQMRLMLWLGLVVAALSVGVYLVSLFILPGYLNLGMAVVGGGGFLLSGLYLTLMRR